MQRELRKSKPNTEINVNSEESQEVLTELRTMDQKVIRLP